MNSKHRVKRSTPESKAVQHSLITLSQQKWAQYLGIFFTAFIYSLIVIGETFLLGAPLIYWMGIEKLQRYEYRTASGQKKFWRWYGIVLAIGLGVRFLLGAWQAISLTFVTSIVLIAVYRAKKEHFTNAGGTTIETYEYARAQHQAALQEHEPSIKFGGCLISFKDACLSFLFVGGQGAGKTMQIRLILRDTLGRYEHTRGMVYDPSGEYYGFLRVAGVAASRIIKTMPTDPFCYAWDVQHDINSEELAIEFAGLVFSEKSDNNQVFWDNAVSLVVYGVVMVFIYRGLPWDLLDLLNVTKSAASVEKTLKSREETEHLAEQLGTAGTASNIMTTLATKSNYLISIAKKWRKAREAGRTFSFRRWKDSNHVLLLGYDALLEAQLGALNRALLTIGGKIALMRDTKGRGIPADTFFNIDELGNLGGMSIVTKLLTEGRKKGICFVAGFQNIEMILQFDEHKRKYRDVILETFGHKAFLKMDGVMTAKWAASQFGQKIGVRQKKIVSRSRWGLVQGRSFYDEQVREPNLTEDAFLDIPMCGDGVQIEGWFITRYRFNMAYTWDSIMRQVPIWEGEPEPLSLPPAQEAPPVTTDPPGQPPTAANDNPPPEKDAPIGEDFYALADDEVWLDEEDWLDDDENEGGTPGVRK